MTPTRLHRAPHVLWRRTLDTVLLLPPGIDEPFVLAGTGPALWELLAEPRALDDLVAVLAAAYEADPDVVAADVAPTVDRLTELGAIERV